MVGKLDVALEHVETAVLLTALDASPRSTHLQVMAADELIRNVASARGVNLAIDMESAIRPEKRKEWRDLSRKSYNYFKHADRDPHELFSGPSDQDLGSFNDLALVQSIINLRAFGIERRALDRFQMGVLLAYPEVMDWTAIQRNHSDLWEGLSAAMRPPMNSYENMMAITLGTMIAEGMVSNRDLQRSIDFSETLR